MQVGAWGRKYVQSLEAAALELLANPSCVLTSIGDSGTTCALHCSGGFRHWSSTVCNLSVLYRTPSSLSLHSIAAVCVVLCCFVLVRIAAAALHLKPNTKRTVHVIAVVIATQKPNKHDVRTSGCSELLCVCVDFSASGGEWRAVAKVAASRPASSAFRHVGRCARRTGGGDVGEGPHARRQRLLVQRECSDEGAAVATRGVTSARR